VEQAPSAVAARTAKMMRFMRKSSEALENRAASLRSVPGCRNGLTKT
jgi:hypothetical protein